MQASLATTSSPRPSAFKLAMAGLAGFAVLTALATDDGPVLCPIRRCSGGYCPACGMTRSGGRLLRADVVGSWQLHPYLLIALPQILVATVAWKAGATKRLSNPGRVARLTLAVNATIMIAIWVMRMANGSIPVPFLS